MARRPMQKRRTQGRRFRLMTRTGQVLFVIAVMQLVAPPANLVDQFIQDQPDHTS